MWIDSLNLEVWIINIFAGSQEIFLAVALFFIFGMAAYFRMNGLVMVFMLGLFLIMFNAYVASYMLLTIAIIGGLLLGYWVSKIVKN